MSSSGRFSFLNAGFPVNLDGRMECLPATIIQPTHALLFAAGVQALARTEPGLTAIDPDTDEWIFDEALCELERSPELEM